VLSFHLANNHAKIKVKESKLRKMWYKPSGKVFNKRYLMLCKKYFPPEITATQVQFIIKVLKLKPKMKILDLACGWGRHSIELASQGYEVAGIDINPLYLSEGEKSAKELNLKIRWIKKDIREIPFKNKFDVVLSLSNSFGYFEKEQDHQKVICEVAKALKPKGFFLLDVRHLESLIYQYQLEQKKQLAKDHFLIIKSSFDFLRSRWNEEIIEFWKNKKKEEISYSIRAFTTKELISLCQKAGLIFKESYGNYQGDPISFESERCILITQKP